jgi:HK97 family phage portal protein
LRLLAYHGAVSFIADHVATLPVDIQDASLQRPPMPRWVEQPNPEMDRVDLVGALVASMLTDGTGFVAVVRDNRNTVAEVYALDPTKVEVAREDGQVTFRVAGKPAGGEIHMVRGLMWPGTLRGLSPVEYARVSIGAGLGLQEQTARFFAQGTLTPGVIESQVPLTPDQMRDIRDAWQASHGGSRRSHLPVVLGNATYKPITMTAEQAQFLESRKWSAAELVGQLFHLDPSFLAIPVESGSLTYQNLEQRDTALVRHTLRRWIVRIERLMTRLLPPSQTWRFDVDGLLRGDMASRFAAYEIASRIGLLSMDEMRALEDRPPLPESGGVDDASSARAVAELVQKIYLGVGKVLTAEEARRIANRAGAGLDIPGPDFGDTE